MSNLIIRPAKKTESQEVYDLLVSYAAFDGSSSSLKVTQETLSAELFSDHPTLYALVAQDGVELVGLLLFYYSFSSWQARKCLWIEDLYLVDKSRGKGIGRLFLEETRRIARSKDCARVDWHVPVSYTHLTLPTIYSV